MIDKEQKTEGLFGSWFYNGGQWSNHDNSIVEIRTARYPAAKDKEDKSVPHCWGLFYQHPDSGLGRNRFWYIDLGVALAKDGGVVFSMRTSHALNREFVGVEPPAPSPTVPKFVRQILNIKDATAQSGQLPLVPLPTEIKAGQAHLLEEAIFKVKRYCPIVVVNGGYSPTAFPIRPADLQHRLMGKAHVFWCGDDPDLGDELPWLIPQDYACRYHSVRVYHPNPQVGDAFDARRHRFFPQNVILEEGGEKIAETIAQSLHRGFSNNDPEGVLTIADIESRSRKEQLDLLRSQGKPTQEYIELLEATNRELESDNVSYKSLLAESDLEIAALKEERAGLTAKLGSLRFGTPNSSSVNRQQRDALLKLEKGQGTPSDCLLALKFVFSDRVRILESAEESASDSADFKYSPRLWELLKKMCTEYFDILARGGAGDATARSVFGHDSFSAKESESVMSSPKLASRRIFKDQGQDRAMFRHLKIGVADNTAETIRVHFDWDSDNQEIVIGHCGPHLPLK